MLEELAIQHLGPIEDALIMPSRGMTAITGETGAGKSMLLNAVQLIAGCRADVSRIAPDAQQAWVQAVFCVSDQSPVVSMISEAGIHGDACETVDHARDIFVARSLPRQGRSRASVCAVSAPKSLLERIGEHTITIHGQSDQLRIASVSKQRDFLDMVARNSEIVDRYAQCYQTWVERLASYERLLNQESSLRQRADYLRESLAVIERVDPHVHEDHELREERDRIEHATQIIQSVSQTIAYLDVSQLDTLPQDQHNDALSCCNHALHALDVLQSDHNIAQLREELGSIVSRLSEIVLSLTRYLDIDGSEENLDAINERIHDLHELTRRWGPTLESVLAWKKQAEFELEDLDDSPEAIERARLKSEEAYKQLAAVANELSESRMHAASMLSRAVSDELSNLAMSGAHLVVQVHTRKPDPQTGRVVFDAHGQDDVVFLFQAFPNAPQLPMAKSASGGELSRLMLAMELVAARLHDSVEPMTFIFDEVDAGVGGKAAVELGRRLALLSKHAQVIVVTHLAQVASYAQRQFVVRKETRKQDDEETLVTRVVQLEGEDREREIARMLAGSESATSLDHARELLAQSKLSVINESAE